MYSSRSARVIASGIFSYEHVENIRKQIKSQLHPLRRTLTAAPPPGPVLKTHHGYAADQTTRFGILFRDNETWHPHEVGLLTVEGGQGIGLMRFKFEVHARVSGATLRILGLRFRVCTFGVEAVCLGSGIHVV